MATETAAATALDSQRPTDLLAQVQERERFARRWWFQNQVTSDVLMGVGWIINALVPFGFASLLYSPEHLRVRLTVLMLGASALALALHVLVSVLRFHDKADNHRRVFVLLEKARASYYAGGTLDKLASDFGAALDVAATEPGAG